MFKSSSSEKERSDESVKVEVRIMEDNILGLEV
jgi:hypothetical protein